MKKTQKSVFLLLLAICFSVSLLAGCGTAANQLVGTWKFEKLTSSGHEITASALQAMTVPTASVPSRDDFYKNLTQTSLNFQDGGKVTVQAGSVAKTGTWKQDGEKITITDVDTPYILTLQNNKLSLEQGGAIFVFQKA
ncbi:lipocalin family protein [Caproicibacterium amylolyticum]|uniref:Lipocalin family protein n=1 Tax=Caproicibacterium amylolyticum TaxID=2766537 RepID=A0A7G9WER6_9FIRM|nr:lipocalin family protein [Caproicibacterium amylolyticum]MBE6722410.1 hypothetical protein [Oscillospiraceae bacterium]QNO17178.1 lipocalin family protein [Caproicibacterium amylolyticum]